MCLPSGEIKRGHEVCCTVNANQLISAGQRGCFHGDVLAGQHPHTFTHLSGFLTMHASNMHLYAQPLSVCIFCLCVSVSIVAVTSGSSFGL